MVMVRGEFGYDGHLISDFSIKLNIPLTEIVTILCPTVEVVVRRCCITNTETNHSKNSNKKEGFSDNFPDNCLKNPIHITLFWIVCMGVGAS